jgi:hypothetical protein
VYSRSKGAGMNEQIKNLIAALESLKPKKTSRYAEEFAQVFNTILAMLKQDVAQKDILQTLGANGFEMSPATFRKLVKAQCDARGIQIDTTKKGATRYRA